MNVSLTYLGEILGDGYVEGKVDLGDVYIKSSQHVQKSNLDEKIIL